MRERLRADLSELLEFLRSAEDRAEAAGDALLARDAAGNRYASEAGSLLATVDGAIKRVRAIVERLGASGDV